MAENFLQKPQRRFSRIQKFIIRWKTRSLGSDVDAFILVMSVLIYMGRSDLEERFERAKEIINTRFKQFNMGFALYERIEVEVAEFLANEALYIRARYKVFEEIVRDIQLYGIVLDMLQGEKDISKLQLVRSVVQKSYDDEYQLTKEAKRILEAQEKNPV